MTAGLGAAFVLSSCGALRHGNLRRLDDAERVDVTALTPEERELARAEIRRAISLLIDRVYVCDDIQQNGSTPATTIVCPGFETDDGTDFTEGSGEGGGYYDASEDAIADNYEKAMSVLERYYDVDEATGTLSDFPSFTYKYIDKSGDAEKAIGEYLQEILADIGIKVSIVTEDVVAFLTDVDRGAFQLCSMGWSVDYPDPLSLLQIFASTSPNDYSHLGKGRHGDIRAYDLDLTPFGKDVTVEGGTWAETYDVPLDAIANEGDEGIRYRLLHVAEDMVMATGTVIPYAYGSTCFLASKRVGDFELNNSGIADFCACTVDGRPDMRLDISFGGEPVALDPGLVSTVEDATIASHLFSGLARWVANDDGSIEVYPDCAQEIVEGVDNEDGTVTYTYTLREGLTWSDGVPVTAHDFEYAWKRNASVEFASPQRELLSIVCGYDEGDLDVHAADDRTFVVTLPHRVPYWDALLTNPLLMPVRADVATSDSWDNSSDTIVCNGPFRMTEWEHDSIIVTKRRPEYWDAEHVLPAAIEWHLTNDVNTCLRNWETGDWLFVRYFSVSETARLRRQYPKELRIVPQLCINALLWNANFDLLPA